MSPEDYLDLYMYTKSTVPIHQSLNYLYAPISTELMVWLFVYFGSFFVACGLSAFVYNYITENRFARREHRQQVYIVRSNPEFEMGDEIIDYIKGSASRPFRIISVDSDPKKSQGAYRKFMKRIMNTNEGIYILGRNEHSWEYENYIYLAKQLNVPFHIVEFSREGVEPTYEYPTELRTSEQIVL